MAVLLRQHDGVSIRTYRCHTEYFFKILLGAFFFYQKLILSTSFFDWIKNIIMQINGIQRILLCSSP